MSNVTIMESTIHKEDDVDIKKDTIRMANRMKI